MNKIEPYVLRAKLQTGIYFISSAHVLHSIMKNSFKDRILLVFFTRRSKIFLKYFFLRFLWVFFILKL